MLEEFFTIVGRENPKDCDSRIIPCGCVTRNLAHSNARVPPAAHPREVRRV